MDERPARGRLRGRAARRDLVRRRPATRRRRGAADLLGQLRPGDGAGRGQGRGATPGAGHRSSATRAARASTSASSATGASSSRARRGSASVFTGHITGLSSVDVKNIGAGGGSIAWIDSGGLLRVGPQSAGAEPGPACYGRGGTEPTVTDAAVVLGYLDPEYFLGGRITLDAARGARGGARASSPTPLGLARRARRRGRSSRSPTSTWSPRCATSRSTRASTRATRCSSPAAAPAGMTMAKIAAGARLHARARARAPRRRCRRAGGLFGDVVTEFTVSRRTDTRRLRLRRRSTRRSARLRRADGRLLRPPRGSRRPTRHKEFFVEARYPYQVWELEVPLRQGRASTARRTSARLVEAFHEVHERVFAVNEPGQRIECLYWKGRATVRLPNPPLTRRGRATAGRRARRRAAAATWWGTSEPREVADLPRRRAAGRRPGRGPGDRRAADDDDRRLPGLDAARSAESGGFMLERSVQGEGASHEHRRPRPARRTRSCSR